MRRGKKRICVVSPCRSGKTVLLTDIAAKAVSKKNHVWAMAHVKEIVAQLEKTARVFDIRLDMYHIGMVQTLTRRVGTAKQLPEPKLIIIDECHHTPCKSYRNIMEAFPDAYVIGFTATPELSGRGLGEDYDELINVIHPDELIKQNYLSDYRYFNNKLVSTSGVKTVRGDYEIKEINLRTSQQVVYDGAVTEYLAKTPNKKALVYCTSIANAMELAENFRQAGVSANFITGSQQKYKRDEAMEAFRRGEIKVLTSCNIVSEGVDIPDCEVCILLRPTKSLTLYIQQSMRCLNPLPGKTAYILDLVGNFDNFGFPTQARNWELFKNENNDNKNEVKTRTCPECYMVLFSTQKICDCGHDMSDEVEREEREKEAAELEELDRNRRIILGFRECITTDELIEVVKIRNYKPISAIYKAIENGMDVSVEHLKLVEKMSNYKRGWHKHAMKSIEEGTF